MDERYYYLENENTIENIIPLSEEKKNIIENNNNNGYDYEKWASFAIFIVVLIALVTYFIYYGANADMNIDISVATSSEFVKSKLKTSTNFVTKSIKEQMPTIIISSLTLIAGLSWNNFFRAVIEYYVPEQFRKSYGAWIQVGYALLLTIIIVTVIAVILQFVPK